MQLFLDTSVIVILWQTSLLDKLRALSRLTGVSIAVTPQVLGELAKGPPANLEAVRRACREGWMHVLSPGEGLIEELQLMFPNLGEGELSVIACVKTSMGAVAILDDERARRAADELGLAYHGTLWLVMKMKRSGLLSRQEALKVVEELVLHHFYVSEEIMEQVVSSIERDC